MSRMAHSIRLLALLLAAACGGDDPDGPPASDADATDSPVDSPRRSDSGGADAPGPDVATGGADGSSAGGNGGMGGGGRDGGMATDGGDTSAGGGTGGVATGGAGGVPTGGAGGTSGDASGDRVSADGGPCDPPACFAAVVGCTAAGACVSQRQFGHELTCYANGVSTDYRGFGVYFFCGFNTEPVPGGFYYSGIGTIVTSQTHITYTCAGQSPVAIDRRACPHLRYPMYGDMPCTVLPIFTPGDVLLTCPSPRNTDGGS